VRGGCAKIARETGTLTSDVARVREADATFELRWPAPQRIIGVISGIVDHSTKINDAISKRRQDVVSYLVAAITLVLCLTQAPSAHADSASCLAKVSSYVAELDELLSKERNWNTPYENITKKYFPIYDCEADALLEVVRGSHFIRSISYHSRTNQYFILFSSGDVEASFAYLVSERKSSAASAGLAHK
jgi:hypothetical protein